MNGAKKKQKKERKEYTQEDFDKAVKDFLEDVDTRFGRGFSHRMKNVGIAIILTIALEGPTYLLLTYYPALKGSNLIDPTQVVSIFVAEIPIGVILWVAFQRRESESRRVLDAIEIDKAIAEFEHLVIHASDPWTYAAYPDKRYFVVNTKTKKAYFVSDRVFRLQRAGIVERVKRYPTYEALLQYFKVNGIEIVKQVGEGSDLSLGLGLKLGPVLGHEGD